MSDHHRNRNRERRSNKEQFKEERATYLTLSISSSQLFTYSASKIILAKVKERVFLLPYVVE